MKNIILAIMIIAVPAFTSVPGYGDGSHPGGIKLDGTIGNAGQLELPGPDYEIRAEYGQQAGANLFHSFQQFNIRSDESATFTGPDSVRNIISRVTGGDASRIDGKLGSEIPGADLYLLNPAGVMFGKNAFLDIGGSFHVSTADYLRMGENDRFYSHPLENGVMSVSAPSAFGFLDDSIAQISFEGGEIAPPDDETHAGLRVSEGKTVSVIGGNITINGGLYYQRPKTDENGEPVFETAVDENGEPVTDDDGNPVPVPDENGNPVQAVETVKPANIHAEYGCITMAAAASHGEIIPAPSDPDVTSVEKKGDITISDKAEISVSGGGSESGPGSIFIRAGQFAVSDSDINATNRGEKDAGKIDIQADEVSLTDGTRIYANTEGQGKGADIFIKADESVTVSGWNADNETQIRSEVYNEGDAGNLLIEAGNITFSNGAFISTSLRTDSSGDGGETVLKAAGSVSFSGLDSYSKTGCWIQMYNKGAGDGSNLLIEADAISLTDRMMINGSTMGEGKASDVTINASEFIGNCVIYSSTGHELEDAGDGGNILIEADNITLADTLLLAHSSGKGNAGDVTLKAADSASFSGFSISLYADYEINCATRDKSEGAGDAGNVLIEAKNISFRDGFQVVTGAYGRGNAGNIRIHAREYIGLGGKGTELNVGVYEKNTDSSCGSAVLESGGDIRIDGGAEISAENRGEGTGGNIDIRASGTVTVSGEDSQGKPGSIYAGSAGISPRAGSGGKIFISADILTLSGKGKIYTSSAGKGKAGSIELDIRELRMDSGSSVSSGSDSQNFYTFDNISDLDSSILILGDVVEVADIGDGKSRAYVNIGDLIRFTPLYTVQSLSELNELENRYVITYGDLAELTEADGEHGSVRYLEICPYLNCKFRHLQASYPIAVHYREHSRYMYVEREDNNDWVKFDSSQPDAVLENMSELVRYDGYSFENDDQAPPYEHGDVIRVADAGDGRAATYIFKKRYVHESNISNISWMIRLTRFDVADTPALNELTNTISIRNGDVARVADAGAGSAADFVFQDGSWIKFNNDITVADNAEMDSLVFARPGHVADVADTGTGKPGTFICTGTDWLPLGNVHIAENTSQLDSLPAQTGDTAYISNADGMGNPANFLYADEKWTQFFKGDGDNILIKAETVTMAGTSTITSSTQGHGDASDISLEVGQLTIDSGSSISSGSNSEIFGGNTGNIIVAGKAGRGETPAETIILENGGSISTNATDAAGGEIRISVRDRLHISSGEITSEVYGGDGKGGDIEIGQPEFVIMNQGGIVADAHKGDGGNIRIVADQFVRSSDSTVSASSELGIDGNIKIESPDTDISGGLTILPDNFPDADRWIKTPCAAKSSDNVSRFRIKGRDAKALTFDDLLPSPSLWLEYSFEKGLSGE